MLPQSLPLPRPTKHRPSSASSTASAWAPQLCVVERRSMWSVPSPSALVAGWGSFAQLPLSPPVPSWLPAIGPHDSSHMRLHRTVQPPPRTRGLQRRSPQPSFCQTPRSHPKRRVDAPSLGRLCRHTPARAKSIFSWMPEAVSRSSLVFVFVPAGRYTELCTSGFGYMG